MLCIRRETPRNFFLFWQKKKAPANLVAGFTVDWLCPRQSLSFAALHCTLPVPVLRSASKSGVRQSHDLYHKALIHF